MGVALTKGGNVSLGKQAPGLGAARVGLGWTARPGHDLDASALLCGRSGKVVSDGHFVFFNNLRSPDGSVRHHGSDLGGPDGPGGTGTGSDRERIDVRLTEVPAEVERIVFAVAIYDAVQRSQTFGQVRGAYIRLTDPDGGTEVVRYDVVPEAGSETAMVFGELYRHGADWKFRAVGQGYATGLAGIAADFGVALLQPAPAPATVVHQASPQAPTQTSTQASTAQQATGSSPVTCFFDPSHGVGSTAVLWSPQWGVPRQIQACMACAQRVQTTPPPFYTPQQGYPQPVQQGYPQGYQQGYPQVPGQGQQGGHRYGTGALVGAGVAGLVGGALLNEALSDDEPEVVVNNYYEGDDDSFF